jgi:adenine-specific DNA-methyltransferase
MVVRYMGTKRHMVDNVRATIAGLRPGGRVVDLFSGMGSVAESLTDVASVVTNDALSFTSAFSRARFTGGSHGASVEEAIHSLTPGFEQRLEALTEMFGEELRRESRALLSDRAALAEYMAEVPHVGNNGQYALAAKAAKASSGPDRYALCSLYFAGGYLSIRQSIEVDALRFAIDSSDLDQDWMLAAWLSATSVLINAPGHTAQFLKPNDNATYIRLRRTWSRSVWEMLPGALESVSKVGTETWRANNSVRVSDALDLIASDDLDDLGAVYADPPYTKDQYSRYYHVYETLYRYDFPDSLGVGRSRSGRFSTGFCLKTSVVASFHDLFRHVARMSVPLVLSYPSRGLLDQTGHTIESIAANHFKRIEKTSLPANHSTMGASQGSSKKSATENVYVCFA